MPEQVLGIIVGCRSYKRTTTTSRHAGREDKLFGMEMEVLNPIAQVGAENGYQYNGKELNEDFGLGLYDYGARWYDAAIGRWNNSDRFSELYRAFSPYNYVLNNPFRSIDPDGNLVIFVNGFTPFKEQQGSSRYWRLYSNPIVGYDINDQPILGSERLIQAFDIAVMDQLQDRNSMYIHGGNNFTRGGRYANGYMTGLENANAILDMIVDENGYVTETIKVITHSMGAAFAKGFIEALLKVASRRKIKGVPETLVADFDPFQAKNLKGNSNVHTQQFWHDGGAFGIADQVEKNAEVEEDKNRKSHSIMTFFNDITKLKEGEYEWNGQKWVCRNCSH